MKLKYLFTLSLVGLLAVTVSAQKIRIKYWKVNMLG